MLILSRRLGESLTIGDDVVVTVLSVGRNQIRLGITAPRQVRVLRQEVYKATRQDNQAAVNLPDSHGSPGAAAGPQRRRKLKKSRDCPSTPE